MKKRMSFAGFAAVAVIAIAGCGSSSTDSGSSTTSDTSSSIPKTSYGASASTNTAPATSSAATTIDTTKNADLGPILVDSKGNTLYLFKKDTGGTSSCDGACAGAWPPVTTTGSPKAGSGAKASLLGTTKRTDGTTQVTYNNWPLYLYEGDSAPGDTNGNDFSGFGNGDTGISQIPLPSFGDGKPLSGVSYDLVLAAAAVSGVVILILIVRSSLGRRLIAIREDDELAGMLGINVTGYKMVAFFIGSLFAGIGGALYAPYIGFISPRSFDVLISMNIWLMVAFGGRGTIWGPVIGAALLAPLSFLLQEYYTVKDVLYGLLIIAVIVLMPAGIAGGFGRTSRLPAAEVDASAQRRSSK